MFLSHFMVLGVCDIPTLSHSTGINPSTDSRQVAAITLRVGEGMQVNGFVSKSTVR